MCLLNILEMRKFCWFKLPKQIPERSEDDQTNKLKKNKKIEIINSNARLESTPSGFLTRACVSGVLFVNLSI